MCQNSKVAMVVDGFVSKGFMFTAFDVTKFMRASGIQIHHSEVNTAVKEMFRDGEMSNYLRDSKDIGAPVAPLVYYHQNSDLDKYSPDWLENDPSQDKMKNDGDDGSGTVAGVAQPTPSSYGKASTSPVPVKSAKVTLPNGVHGVDKEGRLYIAPVVTQSVGLVPYQNVSIYNDNFDKVVIDPANMIAFGARMVSVNGDGRIRVCRSLLKKISPSTGLYMINTFKGTIEIRPA